MWVARPKSQFIWKLKPISEAIALHLPSVCRQVSFEAGKGFIFAHNASDYVTFYAFSDLVTRLAKTHVSRTESVITSYNWLIHSLHDSLGRLKVFHGLKCVVVWYMIDLSEKQKAEATT